MMIRAVLQIFIKTVVFPAKFHHEIKCSSETMKQDKDISSQALIAGYITRGRGTYVKENSEMKKKERYFKLANHWHGSRNSNFNKRGNTCRTHIRKLPRGLTRWTLGAHSKVIVIIAREF